MRLGIKKDLLLLCAKSLILLVARTGIEPVTRGFSTVKIAILLSVKARHHSLRPVKA